MTYVNSNRRAAVRLLLLLGLAPAGCTRHFEAPHPAAPLALSTPCEADAQCGSGVCADGVCCERVCDPSQSCDVAGAAGHCTARPLGSACQTDAGCPTGFCVDGVCCDSACDGQCQDCNLPGQAGRCSVVADGNDPRRDCGFPCTACYGGTCGPAPLDANPEGRCDAGLVCSLNQVCAEPTRASCTQDDQCASGLCLEGACTRRKDERVTVPAFQADAQRRYVLASTIGSLGQVALVVSEFSLDLSSYGCDNPVPGLSNVDASYQSYATVTEDRVLLLERGLDGTWSGQPIADSPDYDCGGVPAAVAYQGNTVSVALFTEPDFCDPPTTPCGVFLVGRSASGTAIESVDAHVKETAAIALAPARDGRLAIAYDGVVGSGARHLFTRIRTPGQGWSAPTDLGAIEDASGYGAPYWPRATFGLRWFDGRVVVVFLPPQGGQSSLAWWDGATQATVSVQATPPDGGCAGGFSGPVTVDAASDQLEAALGCSDPPYDDQVLDYAPDGGLAGLRTFGAISIPGNTGAVAAAMALPASPAVVALNYDDGAAYPLAQISYVLPGASALDLYDNGADFADSAFRIDSLSASSEPGGHAVIAWTRGSDEIAQPLYVTLIQR